MENALAAVKGTAFGLEEAATVAAGMVAAGIKPGQELEGVLKTVGDTAAIAGVSMQDMGSIFGKVAATGKLQGDELMQLSDAGIPALSLLSKHLGKTTEEVRDMVSDGKVSFADFEAAVGRMKVVLECSLVAGDFDYLLKVRVGDMKDFNRLHAEALIALPGVRQIRTFFVIREVKRDGALPF